MKAKEDVIELLDLEIGIYTVLRDMLVAGELEVVSVVAGTDRSRPDHYIFQGAQRYANPHSSNIPVPQRSG